MVLYMPHAAPASIVKVFQVGSIIKFARDAPAGVFTSFPTPPGMADWQIILKGKERKIRKNAGYFIHNEFLKLTMKAPALLRGFHCHLMCIS